tara:strand:- start:1944 stop:2180 length:237 start_codon:yes stop_codon:yes gene_type:complete
MMFAEQVTMPEGIVKGPESVLPKKSIFNGENTQRRININCVFYSLLAANALAHSKIKSLNPDKWLDKYENTGELKQLP